MQNLCKASFSHSLCRIIRLIKYNTIHKFSQTSNCLWDQKAISAIGSRSSTVRCQCRVPKKGWAQLQDEIWGAGAASQAFKRVTWTRFSSGVPGRCQILGSAGSNPWPLGCRWASVLCQMKPRSAGRYFWWCFLWSRSRCWSEISWDVFQRKPFTHFERASWRSDKRSIQTCLGASVWTYSEKILLAEEIISGTVLIFLYSSQANQNRMFSSLYSDLRNSRKAICPAEEGEGTRRSTVSSSSGISTTHLRVSPLQLRTMSTDSVQVSTSPSGSLWKQHNLPLKRASRAITSPVTCWWHDTGLRQAPYKEKKQNSKPIYAPENKSD